MTTTHYHRYRNYGPYNASVCVIFRHLGPHHLTFHVSLTTNMSLGDLSSEENSIFKIPAGYTATVELCEVTTGLGGEGKYVLTCTLHPPVHTTHMHKLTEEEALEFEDPPEEGECTGPANCEETGPISCPPGQHGECPGGTQLRCVSDQPGN